MGDVELLWFVYDWLPRLFVLDLLLFHLIADHPIAARWWCWRSPRERRRGVAPATLL